MTLEQRILQIYNRQKDFLIFEGYIKGDYEALPENLSEYLTDENYVIEKGANDNGACGTKRCLIGALSAAVTKKQGDYHPILKGFCNTDHDERSRFDNVDEIEFPDDSLLADRESISNKKAEALVAAYDILNIVAAETTTLRSEWVDEDGHGAAESYAEHPNVTRKDLIELIDRAIARVEQEILTSV